MSAYLKFFELEQSPFEGNAQTQVVLGTQALRDALAAIEQGLEEDASRICVNGDRGLGKTSLARALPKLLGDRATVAIIPDPSGSWESVRTSIAKQFGLEATGLARARLLDAARERRLVLVIDDAQNASEEFLDHLDVVLSYRTEDDRPVIQSVLLARLKRDPGATPAPLVWWLDRIQTLQLEFAPLPRAGVASYIQRHLKRAGWRGSRLFSEDAAHAIHGYTAGIPGEVSALCERLLGEASTRKVEAIDAAFVHAVCDADHDAGQEPDADPDLEEEAWSFDGEFAALDFTQANTDDEADASAGAALDRDGEVPVSEAGVSPSLDVLAAMKAMRPLSRPDAVDSEGPSDDAAQAPTEVSTDSPSDAGPTPKFGIEDTAPLPIPTIESDGAALGHQSSEFGDEYGDALLDGPATPEELRALRGGGMSRLVRYFVGGVLAALLAGLVFAISTGGDEATSPADLSDSLGRTVPRVDRANTRSPGALDASARTSRGTVAESGTERNSAGGFLPGGGYVPVEVLDRLGKRSPGPDGRNTGVSE